jgi:hypothetical protein
LTWTAFDFAGLAALLANSSAGCSSGGRQASGCMRMKPFRLYSRIPVQDIGRPSGLIYWLEGRKLDSSNRPVVCLGNFHARGYR